VERDRKGHCLKLRRRPRQCGGAILLRNKAVIDLRTLRDELEHQHHFVLREVHALAERAFKDFLRDVARELDGCRSLAQMRELFRPEVHDLEELAEARVLQRRDEIFMPGVHATALIRAIEIELARVVTDSIRILSYQDRGDCRG
jgi:hypothetical protein